MNSLSLQTSATLLIVVSAVLHATVNTLIKVSDDALITRGCMNAVAFIVAIPIMTIMPLPDPDLWPLLVVSTLIHALYPFFLAEAYRSGDLSATFSAGQG